MKLSLLRLLVVYALGKTNPFVREHLGLEDALGSIDLRD